MRQLTIERRISPRNTSERPKLPYLAVHSKYYVSTASSSSVSSSCIPCDQYTNSFSALLSCEAARPSPRGMFDWVLTSSVVYYAHVRHCTNAFFDLRENTRCYSLHSKPLSFHGTWLLHSATDRRSFKSTRQVRAHADSCSGDGHPHRPSRSQWS